MPYFKRTGLIFVVAALFLMALPQRVFAHANLVSAAPGMNTTLSAAPAEIRLWFSEPLESAFSTITLRDSAGNLLDLPPAQLDPEDAHQLVLLPGDLPEGIYTVAWRVVSSSDGHQTQGSFPFSIGVALNAAAPAQRQEQIPEAPAGVRWLNLISFSLGIGSIGFTLLVWRPTLTGDASPEIEHRIHRLIWLGWILMGLTAGLMLLMHLSVITELPFPELLSSPQFGRIFSTRFGGLWILRMAFWGVMGAALYFGSRRPIFLTAAFFAGLGVLLTHSLFSHSSAAEQLEASVAGHWIHLAAASLWFGGLIQFLNVVGAARRKIQFPLPLIRDLVGRFSNLGRMTVLLLFITGLYAGWLHVGSIEGLLTTLYGQSLAAKLILIVPLIGIAAVNLLLTARGLGAGESLWIGRLRGLIGAEIALLIGVMLAVGAMTSIAPARTTIEDRERAANIPPQPYWYESIVENDGAHIDLELRPGYTGDNLFTIYLYDHEGKPIEDASLIRLRFNHLEEDLGQSELRPEHQGGGVYSISGANVSLPGQWRIRVTVQRPGEFDAVVDFEPQITAPPPPPAPISAAGPLPLTLPLLLLTGSGLLLTGGFMIARRYPTRLALPRLLGAGIAATGLLFLLSVLPLLQAPSNSGVVLPEDAPIKMAFSARADLPFLLTKDGAIYQPDDENEQWQRMPFDEKAQDLLIEAGGVMWAATEGGLWIFREGEGWQRVDERPAERLVSSHGYLYPLGSSLINRVGAGGNLLDQNLLDLPTERENSADYVMLGNHNHVLQHGEDVFLTPDLGLTWQPLDSPYAVEKIATDADGNLLVVTLEGVFRWSGGAWQAFTPLPDGAIIDSIDIFQQQLYATAGGLLFRLKGQEWERVDLPDASGAYLTVVKTQFRRDQLWTLDSSGARLWFSADGESWQKLDIRR